MSFVFEILFLIFVLTIVVQTFYAIFFYLRLSLYKDDSNFFNKGVTVIICAKDEAEMLSLNLSSFLEQDYPDYEVIVVDDQSIDSTKYVLKDFEKNYSNLKVISIEPHVNSRVGKKFALTLAIKTAKFDYLLLSDADCKPVSKNWITTMTKYFNTKDIVLGISPYHKTKGILNKLIRYDDFTVMLQYLSFALAKIPYMGVGRNLAYKKSLFFSVKGFASHIHIPSGDDDLFIKDVASNDNVAIQIHKEADVFTEPKTNFYDWIYQRKRHVSTSKYYKKIHKILLSMISLSQFLFWVLTVILIIFYPNYVIVISLFSFRIVLYYLIYYPIMRKLRQFDLFYLFPLMEFFNLFVQLFFVLLSPRFKSNRWK